MIQTPFTPNLWIETKKQLRTFFPKDVFDTWFAPIEFIESGQESLTLVAPNDFAVIWINDNYLDLIREQVAKLAGCPIKVTLSSQTQSTTQSSSPQNKTQSTTNLIKDNWDRDTEKITQQRRSFKLNPNNTFKNFVIGSCNQLAHAASVAVSNSPAKAYNPLFLYGETGLGKTHLLHSIAHYILDKNPQSKVAYVSCEKFTNEFINAIQENRLTKFRKHYRNIDIILIDDIHFLAGKERIQEEFFHTFNELYESQKQICLSSDRPISEINKLENRLISRFQWGLVSDVQSPDYETRLAILTKKANALGKSFPQEIFEFLSRRIARNIRRLEGALLRLSNYTDFMNQTLTIETVEKLLYDILQEETRDQITIEKIQKKVVDYYQLRMSDMVSRRRPNNLVLPRQIAMYLSRTLTGQSLQEIGEAFGGRDHGTIIHACRAVENMMQQDHVTRHSIEYLSKQLSH